MHCLIWYIGAWQIYFLEDETYESQDNSQIDLGIFAVRGPCRLFGFSIQWVFFQLLSMRLCGNKSSVAIEHLKISKLTFHWAAMPKHALANILFLEDKTYENKRL